MFGHLMLGPNRKPFQEKDRKKPTGSSTGTSDGNLASLPYIKRNGENFVVVCILDLSEKRLASRYWSQSSC